MSPAHNDEDTNKCYILLSTYYVSGTVLSTGCERSHTNLRIVLGSRYYYYAYLNDEETEGQRSGKFKDTSPAGHGLSTSLQALKQLSVVRTGDRKPRCFGSATDLLCDAGQVTFPLGAHL